MCRALKVLCVADDEASLRALRQATTAAEWELIPGATNDTDALATIDAERPQTIVVFGEHDRLVALVRSGSRDADRDGSRGRGGERRGPFARGRANGPPGARPSGRSGPEWELNRQRLQGSHL